MKILRFASASVIALGSLAFAQNATIDFSSLQQEIDGFGASSAGHGALTATQMDAAFSNDNQNQLGLSILRVEIDVGGQSAWGDEKGNAAGAKARGAKYVLATPWSPPVSMKTNNNTVEGELSTSSYAAYAAYLKSYRTYMGDLVDVISVQNEPNVVVGYLSCSWNPTQLLNFVKNNAQDIGGSVMMPETFNFDVSYSDPSLNDSTANSHFTHIGLHLYGAQIKTYTNAVNKNKKIWMTEHYFDPDDIGNALNEGKEIMDCLNNQMNAYVWWYLRTPNCNLINDDASIQLKGYVMGQFSKYVRPGSHRVTATYAPQSDVTVMAFSGTKNVIIALNQGTSTKTQTFNVGQGDFTNHKRYTTSSSKKLADAGSTTVSNGTFTATLDAQSITTFVAEGTTGVETGSKPVPAIVRDGGRIRAEGSRLVLRDLQGRSMRIATGGGGTVQMDLGGLPSGVYLATTRAGSLPVMLAP
jgi:glucuronoarabinoxylan endo-1,4-beta-xylanase